MRPHSPWRIRLLWIAVLLVSTGIVALAFQLPFFRALDTSVSITYFIAPGETGSGYRESDRDLAEWALEAWAAASGSKLQFEPSSEDEALIRIYWVPAGAGQYGEMRPIEVEGRRGAEVYIRPDTDALGPDIGDRARGDRLFRDTVVYLTCLHETGHAIGLEHTDRFADIMYYFGYGGDIPRFFQRYRNRIDRREDISMHAGISEGDRAQLAALYSE